MSAQTQNLQSKTERLITRASDCRALTDRWAFSRGGETPSRCVLSWWYHFYTIQRSSQLSLFPFFAWLGSMSLADRNWPRTVATEITGVKLPQLADNCNKQAVSRAKPPLKRPPASHLRKVTMKHLEAQQVEQKDKHKCSLDDLKWNPEEMNGDLTNANPSDVSHICGICCFQIPTWMNRF